MKKKKKNAYIKQAFQYAYTYRISSKIMGFDVSQSQFADPIH